MSPVSAGFESFGYVVSMIGERFEGKIDVNNQSVIAFVKIG